tara:strand:+ start:1447 stop:1761 length:315 start_codon:yes stop_codon:yes gene_type:complete
MGKIKVTFAKAEGNGREDGCTESAILVDGQVVGFLTSTFDKVDPCDWYSSRSMRCVSVDARIFDRKDACYEVAVYKGYSKIPGVTAASARADVKRWVKSYLQAR